MTYFKVDDGLWGHPKFDAISDEATSLWVRAGSWSCRYLTDGFIQLRTVMRLGKEKRHADELVAAGLWSECGDGYAFHDWTHYQESKGDVEARREKWRGVKSTQRSAKPLKNTQMSTVDTIVDSTEDSTEESKVESKVESLVLSSPLLSSPDPIQIQSKKAERESAKRASVAEQVRAALSRYAGSEDLLSEARAGCALSRRNGKLADTVWLRFLESAAQHPVEKVISACQIFCERYADGEKSEMYLLGIIRGEARGKRGKRGNAAPAKHEQFQDNLDSFLKGA